MVFLVPEVMSLILSVGFMTVMTSLCVFCCISRSFAFGGRSVALLMDHGTMSHLMFGLIKATKPPRKMMEKMR